MSTFSKVAVAAAVLAGLVAPLAQAQVAAPAGAASTEASYPSRPVRVITAGAGTLHDVVTRRLGQHLSEHWGQAVVVDNQAAAGLTIGTAMAARAAPDGYTLVMADRSSIAVAPSLFKKLPYDPLRDLEPVALVARAPLVLVANALFPPADLREMLLYCKQHPGVVNYASAGPGSAPHIAGEVLKRTANIDIVNVQYKGGAPALTAILAGEVQVGFFSLVTSLAHIKAGRLKVYAIASESRLPSSPDIPTGKEQGLPGLQAEQWIGVFAPARTPRAVIEKLNRDIVDAMRSPAMRDLLSAQGATPSAGSPEALAAFAQSEFQQLRALIQISGIKPD